MIDRVSPSWKALSPHRPLAEGDARYVPRTDKGGGEYLARLIAASPENIVIVGPAGIGKSTELAHAAARLETRSALVQIDKLLNLRTASRDDMLAALITKLDQVFPTPSGYSQGTRFSPGAPPEDRFIGLLRRLDSFILLLDGLEKAIDEPARGLVQLLFERTEHLRTVVVLPPSLVIGPSGYLMTSQSRVFPVRPPIDPGPFLLDILSRRLQLSVWPEEFGALVKGAIDLSGGVPRLFLQLLLNAGTNAALAGREWPSPEDFQDAVRIQAESLALLLRDGDRDVLRGVEILNNGGVDIPLERRLRLLSHGLLLETERDSRLFVGPLPLLRKVL